MADPNLDTLLTFVDLLHKFRSIERTLLRRNSDNNENDSEHSFSLAMIGWYINAAYELNLDEKKLLSYALAHDLVEVYAGDTPFFHTDEKVLKNKNEREAQAAETIKKQFPEFKELHEVIEKYEHKSDKESIFIYALDKIEPILSIYLDKGRTWKKNNVTFEMLVSMKSDKVALDVTVEKIFKELVGRLKDEHAELFNALA